MAQAKFDIPTHVPVVVARPIYAGVGATDRVVEVVREAVADAQKRAAAVQQDVQKTVAGLDYQPQALREQATKAVTAGVDTFGKDAIARRRAIEQLLADLESQAKNLPVLLQKLIDGQFAETYEDLVRRGETLVAGILGQESTRKAAASAKTTKAKAKSTRTQATKTAKKASSTAKKTARTSPAKSSAKATATSAEETATSAVEATTDAASKVGDSTE